MSFIDLAKERYSCRKFSDKKVEQDKIDKILEVVPVVPTAVNNQPFKVWVLNSENAIKKVSETTSCLFGSNLVFAVGGDENSSWVRPFDSKNFAEIDATIVATHLMLQIHELGLGTTWVGYFEEDKLKANFPEMSGYDIVALFPVGYPADDAEPAPKHLQSKNANELIKQI